MKDIAVIIPTYRDWSRLRLCLAALASQSLGAERFDIVVVNNDPADPCPYESDLPANVLVVALEKPGSYAARNRGVAASQSRILAFTDSDCLPSPQWLEKGLEALEAASFRRHVTGPISVFRPEGCSDAAYDYDRKFAFRSSGAREVTVVTANLMVPRVVFNQVGQFAEHLFSGGDTEWDSRARSKGFQPMFQETFTVAHPARGSVAELARKMRRIAGGNARARTRPFLATVLSRLKPPVNLMRSTDTADLGPAKWLRLFLLAWWLRLVYLLEYLRVRAGGQASRA